MSAVRLLSVFCAMLTLSVGPVFAQPVLSPSQFRDAGIARLRQTDPTAQITTRDELGVTVDIPGDPHRQGMQINFDNAYRLYLDDPSQLDALLTRWVGLAGANRDEAFQRDRIVAVVRPLSQVQSYNDFLSQQPGEAMRLVSRPLAGDLHEVLVFDSADAVAYATAEKLEDLGVSIEEAWTLSRQNLPTRMGDLSVERFENGLLLVGGGNGLAPSSLLLAEFCQGMFARNPVLVVDRDSYVMADAGVRGADDAFHAAARDIIADRQSMSATILVCQNGRLAAETD
ncbi:hypothetical protein [Terricaulis sp.]|uniref:hypothetical protein n=1 Tax=Terricaulis sp. TaxID=2768686 RepID=UPI00378481F0